MNKTRSRLLAIVPIVALTVTMSFLAALAFPTASFADCSVSTPADKCCDYTDPNGNIEHFETSFFKCDDVKSIAKIMIMALNIVTALAGIAIFAGILYGSYMYMVSRGNPEGTKKAIKIFINVGIGIVLYSVAYILINWLVPGGVFN